MDLSGLTRYLLSALLAIQGLVIAAQHFATLKSRQMNLTEFSELITLIATTNESFINDTVVNFDSF